MILEIIIALFLGIIAGTFTGLLPGIHINLIAVIITGSLASLTNLPIISIIVFLVAMSITHTFLDFIPSIFLGAPEEDSFLSVLPGHQLLKEGKGHEAVIITLYGSLTALIIFLIFIPLFIYLLPKIFPLSKPIIPFILIFASLYLVFREKEFLISLTVFILAGFLGFLTLNLPVEQPLLPLLTGLFGISALLISIKNKTKIPKQTITPIKNIRLPKKQTFKSVIAAALTAPLSSFLPGFGSGQAAVLGSEISDTLQSPKQFLFLVGAINTIVMSLSFITIYSISRSRTGTAVAILEILKTITNSQLTIIILTVLISGVVAFFIGIQISKFSAKHITKINYKYLSIIILSILILTNLIFSNLLGILVLTTSSALGVFCILSKARRINLMGSLLIPTIIFYLTI
tara:strand:+ start:653 stop:1861 length:1209 start_codon:yes stop_codon:yes gene_type:complete